MQVYCLQRLSVQKRFSVLYIYIYISPFELCSLICEVYVIYSLMRLLVFPVVCLYVPFVHTRSLTAVRSRLLHITVFRTSDCHWRSAKWLALRGCFVTEVTDISSCSGTLKQTQPWNVLGEREKQILWQILITRFGLPQFSFIYLKMDRWSQYVPQKASKQSPGYTVSHSRKHEFW